ncbi:MAG: hypothetical protein ABH822_00505 [Patescibacteria group bacterium]
MERFYFDESDTEWQKFKDFTNAQSLFGGSRLAIVSGLAFKDEAASLFKLLVKKEGVVVLLSEEKKLGREFDFLIKRPVIHQEFANLNRQQFGGFIIKEAKERGVELSNEHSESLVGLCAGDTWAAVTELDKISLSKPETRNPKSETNPKSQIPNLFGAIYKLGRGDLKYRLTTLEGLLDQEDAAKIFNLTAYSSGRKNEFADYDAAIKSGKLDYEMALTDFVVS